MSDATSIPGPSTPYVQYLREVQLFVGGAADGIDLSQLHIKFSIKQFTLETPNILQVRVYNVADSTAKRVQQEFTKIVLNAGYEGNIATIFEGYLVQFRRGRESPVDTYLDLTGMDGDPYQAFQVISTTLNAGSDFKQRIAVLAQALGVDQGYVPDVTTERLPRGRSLMGMAGDYVRDEAAASDTNWSILNGQLTMVPFDGYDPRVEAVVLDSLHGMIGFPEQTQDGITVRCLLNPKLQVNGRIHIDNGDIQRAALNLGYTSGIESRTWLPLISDADDGFYRIIVLEHSGDTRGNEYYSDIVCIALAQGYVTPGLRDKGYS